MQVYFYSSFTKKKNSTKQPAENSGTSYTCLLKDNTTVTAPRIQVKLSSSDPTSFTYAYIPSFNRYYFVSEWTYVMGMWETTLMVDPLASFRTGIGNLSPYVKRCSHAYDPDVSDAFYPASNTWASYELSIPSVFDNAYGSYVIGIIGGVPYSSTYDNNMGSVCYYSATKQMLIDFMNYLMSSAFISEFLDSADVSDSMVKNFVDPLQYIESVRYYPFTTMQTHQPSVEAIRPHIGWLDTSSDQSMPKLVPLKKTYTDVGFTEPNPTMVVNIPKNPYSSGTGNEFLAFPPYAQYELLFEPFGKIPLPSEYVASREKIYLAIDTDYVSGIGRLSIGSEQGRCDIGVYNAQLGVSVSLAQITEDILGASTSVLHGAISLATGGIHGISTLMSDVNNAIDSASPKVKTTGSNGSMASYIGHNHGPLLILKYCNCVGKDNTHFGRPFYTKPTSLKAIIDENPNTEIYFLCADGDNDINCYDIEREMINNYLTGGFFYE